MPDPIAKTPASVANSIPDSAKPKKEPEKKTPRDSIRESLETIVFVVVLVFLLKQFVVEAFVIPTGSMAETLYGYQKNIKCPECGYDFPVNSSEEVEEDRNGFRTQIDGYCCPNCRYKYRFKAEEPRPYNSSGDRVLVHKAQYHKFPPARGDVVVFKYPVSPQKHLGAQNYIKRLWGLGGETIAIWRGDLYETNGLAFPPPEPDANGYPRAEDLWINDFCYNTKATHRDYPGHEWMPEDPLRDALDRLEPQRAERATAAANRFLLSKESGFSDSGGFRLIRKSDAVLEAMKRIVYDSDHQSNYLANKGVPPRWKAGTDDWTPDNATMPKVFRHTGANLGWLRYRHLAVDDFNSIPIVAGQPVVPPVPIDNMMGYNHNRGHQPFWVPDLILECQANFTDPNAEVTLELSKGPNRFHAMFAGGNVTLVRTGPNGKELATKPSGINGAGSHRLKFANVDCSLRVWVDGRKVDFGTAGDYDPSVPKDYDPNDSRGEGWVAANDLEAPASIGASHGVEVSKLKLWRDTYFTPVSSAFRVAEIVDTFYVQPGHYLCFGDNSAQSSDSRVWGSVPDRLMLGKASFVFFPLDRIGFIK